MAEPKGLSGGEIKRSGLLEPDTILPHQYFSRKPFDRVEGERRLMLAILEEAVHQYQKYSLRTSRRETRLFREVENWFGNAEKDWLYYFENICDILEIDAQYIRDGLLRWSSSLIKKTKTVARAELELKLDGRRTKRRHVVAGGKRHKITASRV